MMTLHNFLQVVDGSEKINIFDRELKQVYSGTATDTNADLLSCEVWAVYTVSGRIVIEIR
jgi:hypothetical protein